MPIDEYYQPLAQVLPIRAKLCVCCAKRKRDTDAYVDSEGRPYCVNCGTKCQSSCRLVDARGRTIGAHGFTYDLPYLKGEQPWRRL